MLDLTKLIAELDRNTKVTKKRKAVEVAGKKVELAVTNTQLDAAVEEMKDARLALKVAQLENTPLFIPTTSYRLKCYQGDEVFPCVNSSVCNLCKRPEKARQGVIEKGHHLGDDPAVWVCDRYGYPKVVGCRCPKCTTEQGCKYFYYWEPGSGFPVIGSEKKKATWLPATAGWERGVKAVEGQLVHYSIPRVLPSDMYEGVPLHTDIGMCHECLYWDHRLQCPAHVAGMGYWILKRHYPEHLAWALDTYKPAWKGAPAPNLLDLRETVADARKLREEETVDYIDQLLLKQRVERRRQEDPAPDTGEGITYSSLDKRLAMAVAEVESEWEEVMRVKSRTSVLPKRAKKGA